MEMTKEIRDTLVTTLYERCSIGEISRNQRELILQKINSLFVATEAKKNCDEGECDKSDKSDKAEKKLSPKEKYKIFKDEVYKRCANKEFDEDTREALLEKAREEFLKESDDDDDKKEKDTEKASEDDDKKSEDDDAE